MKCYNCNGTGDKGKWNYRKWIPVWRKWITVWNAKICNICAGTGRIKFQRKHK